MNTAIITCRCNVCSESIQFAVSQVGSTITCPHCQMDTVLYDARPELKVEPKAKAPVQPAIPHGSLYCPNCGTP